MLYQHLLVYTHTLSYIHIQNNREYRLDRGMHSDDLRKREEAALHHADSVLQQLDNQEDTAS